MITIKSFPSNLFQSNKILENDQLTNYVIGVFLLIVAVAGNFIAETLSCPIQKLLTENIYVKHIVTILILYFTTGIIQVNDSPLHPLTTLRICLMSYIIFLFFTKMDIYFTFISFIIIIIIYVNFRFFDYYSKVKPEKVDNIKFHKKLNINLFIILYIVLIIGFFKYFFEIHQKKRNLIIMLNFLFGLKKCYN